MTNNTSLPVPLTPAESAEKAIKFGSWFYAEHALKVMGRYFWSILAYSVGSPLAYLFAMGVGMASLINSNGRGDFGGVDYLTFLAPALVASTALMSATGEYMFPVMGGFKWRRYFYGPHASPLTPEQIAQGHIIAVTLRILGPTAIYFLIVVLFGAAPGPWGWVSIFTATLCSLSFGLPLMAYVSTLEQDKGQFAIVQRFIVTPLFLFSGTFFPLTTLPWFLQWIGWISPLWHATELGRVLSYGYNEPGWLSVIHVVYMFATAALGWFLTRRFFNRRMGK
ncbi:ABC transporter permease [Pseudarthrobacter sp. J1738]|uniref:ABC transporter permease n=1 Tax=unclassified Pseudarthrobacter TaxID=2647000 RepID=UPI003D2B5A35